MNSREQEGIQKLLQAEYEASDLVAGAKRDKVQRLKQAKQEAENEIAAYRQQREAQFEKYKTEHMGDSGAHEKKIAQETDAAMRNIQISMDANKEKIITSLLQSVTTVSL